MAWFREYRCLRCNEPAMVADPDIHHRDHAAAAALLLPPRADYWGQSAHPCKDGGFGKWIQTGIGTGR